MKPRCKQRMSSTDTGIKRADCWSNISWRYYPSGKFGYPFVLARPMPRSRNGSMVPTAHRISLIAPGTRRANVINAPMAA